MNPSVLLALAIVVATGPAISGLAVDGSGNVLEDGAGSLAGIRQEPYRAIATDANGNVMVDATGNLVGIE